MESSGEVRTQEPAVDDNYDEIKTDVLPADASFASAIPVFCL